MGDAPGLPSSHLITWALISFTIWVRVMRQRRRRRAWKVRRTRPAVDEGLGQKCLSRWKLGADSTEREVLMAARQRSLYSAALTKGPLTRGLYTPDIHLSQLWRLDILDQGASRFCVWWGSASSWFTDDIFSPHPHLEEGARGGAGSLRLLVRTLIPTS